jgi:type I restriction enzyme M protein
MPNFEDYLNGFTPQVTGGIWENFEFREQLATLSTSNAIGAAIDNLLEPELRLSSSVDNYPVGSPFEPMVREFNLKNNE